MDGRIVRIVFAGLVGNGLVTVLVAQDVPPSVRVGSVSLPSCSAAEDPEYGLVKEKAIQIGGGPMYMSARQQRFLQSLRGPEGQPLVIPGGVASSPLAGDPDHAIIDSYAVSYAGHEPIRIYMDAYHYSEPHVPRGFTCAAALPSVLNPPPPDPFKVSAEILPLAIEQAGVREIAGIPLPDASGTVRGLMFDQFRMLSLAARAAAAAGSPLDPARPSADLSRQGIVILATPLACGTRTIPAKTADIVAAQGQSPPVAGTVSDGEEIQKLLPGISVAASSLAVRYGLANPRPTDRVRITYQEGCDGSAADVELALKFDAPRLINGPMARAPLGSVGLDSALYFQTLIDFDGRFVRPYALIGQRPIADSGRAALAQWRAEPGRINGAPVVTPMVVQIALR